MKKFLITIVVFLVLFLAFDRLFLFFVYNSPSKEVDKRLELVLNGKINKDIIVLGSSKGARDIIAAQLEKETSHTAFNLSYPGSDVQFHEFLLRALIKFNKKPKIVMLTVDNPIEVLPDSLITFRLDRLYPLIKYDYVNQELVKRNEKNEILSKLFILHRLNKGNFDVRQKKFTAMDTLFADGSMPISFQKENEDWNEVVNNTTYPQQKESKVKLQCLQKIIAACKQNNIKLILVSPPMFKGANPIFKKRILEIAGNNTSFYEFDTQNQLYKDKNYFFDLNHLNKKGATIFTDEIATYLKNTKL
jgi:hypothetical protein